MNSARAFDNLNFFTAFFGLLLAPGETARSLFSQKKYHFALFFVVFLFVIVFTPVLLELHSSGRLLYRPKSLRSVVLTGALTFAIFLFLEAVFLRILGIKIGMLSLATTVCFCLAPVILMILTVYVLNYWASGSAEYLTVVLNGHAAMNPGCLMAVPWILGIGCLLIMLVFMYSIKYLGGEMYTVNAFMVTILSLVPLYGAFIIATIVANAIVPGSQDTFREILLTPSSILNV